MMLGWIEGSPLRAGLADCLVEKTAQRKIGMMHTTRIISDMMAPMKVGYSVADRGLTGWMACYRIKN